MSLRKWFKRHVRQVEHVGKKVGQYAGSMVGMNIGGNKGPKEPDMSNMAGNPDDQARSQAAQAMKRQAGAAQISFTGNGDTPASTAG